jgi:hypothetical protein
VAERLKRRWIGIDITHLAITLIKKRLKDQFDARVTPPIPPAKAGGKERAYPSTSVGGQKGGGFTDGTKGGLSYRVIGEPSVTERPETWIGITSS